MKSLKKTLVLLVVLSMLLSAISPVFAASFNDEIDEAYWEHANKLAAVGVIKGDENGNFNATSNITRAEMAVIICKMAGMTDATATASQNIPSVFADVKAGEWYTGWVNLAVDNGMIAGFPDGTFRPNDPLTTNQAITLVVKALGKGDYVDQMGTWPGNYVQEAAKLGLTTKMVNTGSDVANRGNVAILAWEALQVGTWDVTSTTLDGEVRLSESDSLIIKYFKDFVAGSAKNKNFRVKLIEDAVVTKVGKTTSELGANQIVLDIANDGSTKFDGEDTTYYINEDDEIVYLDTIAKYIDAKEQPKKGAKEATYVFDKEDGTVAAYVPAEVADVDGLVNKKVDVLFGANNEVVLLYVTDEVVDEAYVTSLKVTNNEDDEMTKLELTIDGKTYKVNAGAEVSVYDYVIVKEDEEAEAASSEAFEKIIELVETHLAVENSKNIFNRALKAEFSLDSKDRIDSIDFIFSADGYTETTADGEDLAVVENIVKKVTTSGIIKGFGENLFEDDVESLDDDEEIRLIRDNKVASFDEIEEGDVLTIISVGEEPALVYASSTKAEGAFARGKNHTLTVDGNKYNTVLAPYLNIDDEFDEMAKVDLDNDPEARDDIYDFVGEDVELYINFMGEVVGVVGRTTATGRTLGVVLGDAEEDSDDEVSFLKVRIMTADGKKTTYKVYNKKSSDDIAEADAPEGVDAASWTWENGCFTKGDLVIFSADSNKVIKSDKIEVPVEGEKYDFASNSNVELMVLAYDDNGTEGDDSDDIEAADQLDVEESKNILIDDKKVNSKTIYLNVEMTEANDKGDDEDIEEDDEKEKGIEVVKGGWDALVNGNNVLADFAAGQNIYIFYKGSKVIYFVADFMNYQASDAEYAVVTDISTIKNTKEEQVWEVTLYQEGETLVYELDNVDLRETIHEGDFVEYTIANEKIEDISSMVIWKEMEDLKDYAEITGLFDDAVTAIVSNSDAEYMGQLQVDSIDEGWLVFSDEDIDGDGNEDDIAEVEICEDGYVIYDMAKGEMVEDIEDVVGSYVIAIDSDPDDDNGAEIFVIVK